MHWVWCIVNELRQEPARVLTPASSANLGPAFDSAGLALDLWDDYRAEITQERGVRVDVAGEGAEHVPRDCSHLVAEAMKRGFDALDVRPPGFTLRCTNRIPHGMGLGSSAAAIVGGLVLARALVIGGEKYLSDDDLLAVATGIESHPDNLAAALHGGLTIAWLDEAQQPGCVRFRPSDALVITVLLPNEALATAHARASLPKTVPFEDAVRNVASAALLVHAMTQAPDILLQATRDSLHQTPRREIYPKSWEVMTTLRQHRIPSVISGAGPAVLAFTDSTTAVGVLGGIPPGWREMALAPAARGAHQIPVT
jgi:homoserine kinase